MFITDFTQPEHLLSKAEQFLRTLLQVPHIREILELFIMCFELKDKLTQSNEMEEYVFFLLFLFFFFNF